MKIMTGKGFSTTYSKTHDQRFQKTLRFMEGVISGSDKILDLGPENPFSKVMVEKGYHVENTPANTDLDLDFEMVKNSEFTVLTSFEVFEHMVSPFPLLKASGAKKLVASVPLKLWFANAYWNEKDPFDRHYHEFEPRQFDMLLEKAGWKVIKSEMWKSWSNSLGIRPLLRRFTYRYYIVYCERI